MKILQFGKFFPPDVGGIENFIYDLTEELSQKIRCDVLCSNSKNKRVIERKQNYIVIRTASFGKVFSTSISPAMIYWLKKIGNDYDLIHLHLPDPMASLAYFFVRPKTKLILHWYSDIIRQKTFLPLYKPLQNWLIKKADRIIIIAPNYIECSKYLLRYKSKCVFIPVGLNFNKLKSSDEKTKEIKEKYEGRPIILTVGRLVYYKGFEYLIRAVKEIDAYLLIGGSGALRNELENLIKKLKLKNKVFLLGRINEKDLGSYYQACDIFCLPSIEKSEAFGLVQVEAMYFSKPIVSTNIKGSGVGWVNQNHITGVVIPPRDSKALVKAINKIIENPNLKKKFEYNAKRRCGEFDIKDISGQVLKLYKRILI